MLDKLKTIDDRFEAITSQLEDPATYADPDLLRRLTREQKELEPVAEAYRAYRAAEERERSARELLEDPELREMAQEEIQSAKAEMDRLREEMKLLLRDLEKTYPQLKKKIFGAIQRYPLYGWSLEEHQE